MYNKEKIDVVRKAMLRNKETLAVAESVTSGHLQAAFSSAFEASQFFQGGITAYNLGQKTRHLHIEPIYALNCNCVAQRVADEMAIHGGVMFNSQWGIGITGYASPLPEKNVHDLFAYYSISYKGRPVRSGQLKADQEDPVDVQVFYTNEVIKAFADFLSGEHIRSA